VHERWAKDASLVRLGGWWGNDEMARFQTDHNNLPITGAAAGTTTSTITGAARGFIPKPTAEGWSMSTAQVFNMICLKASLALFEEAGFERLQTKSRALTNYLYTLLSGIGIDILTPAEPERRGAQLSLYFGDKGKTVQKKLAEAGIVIDYREPGVIRVSPAPLYNSFEDVYRFYHILGQLS
jgi:kynureninase